MAADRAAARGGRSSRRALAAGRTVVSDRSAWSSLAYQGYGRGLRLGRAAGSCPTGPCTGRWPDLAVLIDVPAAVALAAAWRRRAPADRLERAGRRVPPAGPSRVRGARRSAGRISGWSWTAGASRARRPSGRAAVQAPRILYGRSGTHAAAGEIAASWGRRGDVAAWTPYVTPALSRPARAGRRAAAAGRGPAGARLPVRRAAGHGQARGGALAFAASLLCPNGGDGTCESAGRCWPASTSTSSWSSASGAVHHRGPGARDHPDGGADADRGPAQGPDPRRLPPGRAGGARAAQDDRGAAARRRCSSSSPITFRRSW